MLNRCGEWEMVLRRAGDSEDEMRAGLSEAQWAFHLSNPLSHEGEVTLHTPSSVASAYNTLSSSISTGLLRQRGHRKSHIPAIIASLHCPHWKRGRGNEGKGGLCCSAGRRLKGLSTAAISSIASTVSASTA